MLDLIRARLSALIKSAPSKHATMCCICFDGITYLRVPQVTHVGCLFEDVNYLDRAGICEDLNTLIVSLDF